MDPVTATIGTAAAVSGVMDLLTGWLAAALREHVLRGHKLSLAEVKQVHKEAKGLLNPQLCAYLDIPVQTTRWYRMREAMADLLYGAVHVPSVVKDGRVIARAVLLEMEVSETS